MIKKVAIFWAYAGVCGNNMMYQGMTLLDVIDRLVFVMRFFEPGEAFLHQIRKYVKILQTCSTMA